MKKEMNIQQAATLTGYHEATLTKACQTGEIKARKAGKRWIVETASLLEFGKRQPHKAPRTKSQDNQLALIEQEPQTEIQTDEVDEIEKLIQENSIQETAPEPKREWRSEALFTYEDLLTQYQRGFMQGFAEGRDATKEKVEAILND